MHSRNRRGFTLIEVLVSMAIMAMVVTIAFAGLRVGLNGWERGGRALDEMDRRALVERLIQRQLAVGADSGSVTTGCEAPPRPRPATG